MDDFFKMLFHRGGQETVKTLGKQKPSGVFFNDCLKKFNSITWDQVGKVVHNTHASENVLLNAVTFVSVSISKRTKKQQR